MDPFETMVENIGYHLRYASPAAGTSTLQHMPMCRTS